MSQPNTIRLSTIPGMALGDQGNPQTSPANPLTGEAVDAGGGSPIAVPRLTELPFNVKDYGAAGDGITDDSAAMQATINAAWAGGGIVYVPPGTYLLGSVLRLATIPANRVCIAGAGKDATIIKLSAGAPRAFDFARTADYQTFGNVDLRDFSVDADNVGGKHHVLIGNYINGATQQRLNLQDMRIERIRLYNVLGDETLTNHRLGIWLGTLHLGNAEATQNTLRRIYIADVRVEGGNAGIGVTANVSAGSGCNVYLDDITIERCYTRIGSGPPATYFASTGIHVGNQGFGGRCVVRDCNVLYAGDDGIEINALQDALVENCIVEDCANTGILWKNFRAPPNADTQTCVVSSCDVRLASVTVDAANKPGRAFTVSATTSQAGTLILDNCRHLVTQSTYFETTVAGGGGYSLFANGAAIKRIVLRDFLSRVEGQAVAPAGDIFPAALYINPSTTSSLIGNARIEAAGTKTGGAGRVIWRAANLSGAGQTYDLSVTINNTMTGMNANVVQGLNVGEEAAANVNGVLRLKVLALTDDTTAKGIRIRAGVTIGRLGIQDSDFAGMGAGTEIGFDSTTQALVTLIRNIRWRAAPAPSAIAMGGSPTVYRNQDGYRQFAIVKGGTVTLVEFSRDGATWYDLGVVAGAFLLDIGDRIRVTYTVAPTVTKVPVV